MKTEKIFEIFQDILDIDRNILSLETKPSDIDEWDSMATVNIIVVIEEEFNVKFKLEEIQTLQKIKDFVELLERYKR